MARPGRPRKNNVTLASVPMIEARTLRELKAAEGLEDQTDELMYHRGHVKRKIRTALNATIPYLTAEQVEVATSFYSGCHSIGMIGRQSGSYEGAGGSGIRKSEPHFDEEAAREMKLATYALNGMKSLPLHLKTATELIAVAEPESGKNKSLTEFGQEAMPKVRCKKQHSGISKMAIVMTLEIIDVLMASEEKRLDDTKKRRQQNGKRFHELEKRAKARGELPPVYCGPDVEVE